jgi:heme oxygenase
MNQEPAPPHAALRSRLQPVHARLDAAVMARCLAADGVLDLARLLLIHALALPPLLAALESEEAASLHAGWDEPARLAALHADLRALGLTAPVPAEEQPAFGSPAEMWGALYTLKGSRLGGRLLLRQVEVQGTAAERQATRFLRHGMDKPGTWPRFLADLDRVAGAGGPGWIEAATRGATTAFGIYMMAAATLDPLGAT